MMKIERPRSLKELVVDELRSRIIDNKIQLGAALSENALAADLGMSKTPVREALQQLQLEGLVEVLPQRGSFVFRIAAEQVEQISELRTVLELAACRLAINRNHTSLVSQMSVVMEEMQAAYDRDDTVSYHKLDGAFHQVFIELCGNPFLVEAFSQVGFRTQALRSRLSRIADLNSRSVAEHRQMLTYVQRRDIPELQALLAAHIDQTRKSYLRVLEEQEK
ncbi:GntR family transcriptional regulator [Phyllobacterium sp. 21LDTY02-6]|jgi:DNA-binding GntR family transcriptional regulator|uniref:GntR family transcriptional regulator n=1 Tax=Phyllobacterium sp. 21LDTY02-6 TaxID=2944903 RepID=UPI00202211B7|nr:GntR family transcriptional regulator [Phyllobacterium sp. 21LDTY02-6]MCO4319074.1 GntR family transcriptional regulator [Phyllobacterium sp. 21LDTY02-6]